MPIRINLLAESQAAEELRRRDPAKRAIWVAASFVVMVLVWSSSLQVKIMADNVRLGNLEARLSSRTNEYNQILSNQKKLGDINNKLSALNRLAANRFLQATVLDALQHAPVEGIQVNHLRTEQIFEVVPEIKSTKSESGKVIPGKPGTSIEKIKLIIDARDASANPGNDQITKFKEVLAHAPYFDSQHITTNSILLKNLGAPMLDNDARKPYVTFNLECLYQDRVR